MASYKFVTHWRFEAPIAAVWEEITRSERWPEWWSSVESVVELRKGDANGEKPTRLEGIASGELSGRGRWLLVDESPGVIKVRYDWEVDANKLWMRALAPIARRIFEWNHDFVMNQGFNGLNDRLLHRTV